MEEYTSIIILGIVVALVLLVGLVLRLMGFRYSDMPGTKKNTKGGGKGRGKSNKKTGKDGSFQEDTYEDDGEGGTVWQDDDLYSIKEGISSSRGMKDDDGEKNSKKDEKYESWDDY